MDEELTAAAADTTSQVLNAVAEPAAGFHLSPGIAQMAYLLAAVLFILALKAMGSPRTARRGNLMGALGMLVAVVCTLLSGGLNWTWIVSGLIIGAAAGTYLAITVKMTAMPQMVAMFNGFGGLASATVVIVEFWKPGSATQWLDSYFAATIGLSTLIGWLNPSTRSPNLCRLSAL